MPLRKSTLVTLNAVKALQNPLNLLAGAGAAGRASRKRRGGGGKPRRRRSARPSG
jgi:hypothetical protein